MDDLEKQRIVREARDRKAKNFADVIITQKIPVELVEDLDLSGWRILTKWVNWDLGTNHSVPSVESESLIYQELKNRGYNK